MSKVKSAEGVGILDRVRNILLENERLKSANEELTARNAELSSTITKLRVRLAVSQTNTAETQHHSVPHEEAASSSSQFAPAVKSKRLMFETQDVPGYLGQLVTTPKTAPSGKTTIKLSREYIPLFTGSDKKPSAMIKRVKTSLQASVLRGAVLIAVPNGFIWQEQYTQGSCYTHLRQLLKDGTTKLPNHRIYKQTVEYLAYIEGQWCYMGSFKSTKWTTLEPLEFSTLPTDTKQWVIKRTAGKATRRIWDISSKYASGELSAIRIDLQRVGFNHKVQECLLEAAETLYHTTAGYYLRPRTIEDEEGVSDDDD